MRRMMKSNLLFAAVLSLGLVACGKSEPKEEPAAQEAPAAKTETPAPDSDEPKEAKAPDEPDFDTSEDFEEEAAAAITPETLEKELAALEAQLEED